MKTVNKWIKIGLLIYVIYEFITRLMNGDTDRLMVVLAVLPVLLVPFFVRKVLKYPLSDRLEFCFWIFIFLAQILGCVENWYHSVSWFDLFTHFISGIVTCVIGLVLLKQYRLLDSKYLWLQIIFLLSITLGVASLWEFFEFGLDTFTGSNVQWVIETGVTDTMTDMLIAFAGSILFSVVYLGAMKKTPKKTISFLKQSL